MKNLIPQFSASFIALIILSFLISSFKPVPEEPKQYMVVSGTTIHENKFQQEVNQKLSEGWHLQGGVSAGAVTPTGVPIAWQAMVK